MAVEFGLFSKKIKQNINFFLSRNFLDFVQVSWSFQLFSSFLIDNINCVMDNILALLFFGKWSCICL